MAYQAFYRTYRPQNFNDVVGQKPIIKTLQNALKNNKIGHAYLFCGPRGTGKTTLARIFAKSLNCEHGIGHECNDCENCKAIMNGSHPDVFEIDAASNSGVDNVRELIEQVRYQPILGRYKIYIIDEVHSMTPTAFNALLKTLEEPPENVVFILATTEPQKVLPTILSRVQRFDFGKIGSDDLVERMKYILETEKIDYSLGSLNLIARLADGGARDALSILEQVVSFGGERITEKDVQTLFGLISVEEEIKLVQDLHERKMKQVIDDIREKYKKGADLVRLHDDLVAIYRDLLVYGTTREPSLLNALKPEEALKLAIGPSEIRRNIDILVEARRSYRLVNNSFDHLELTLINILSEEDEKKPGPSSNPEQPIQVATKKKAPPAPANDELASFIIEPLRSPTAEVKQHTDELKSIGEERLLHLSDDDLINIMIQGDKHLKERLLDGWGSLANYISDPAAGAAVSYLRSTAPRIANTAVVVVEAGLISQVAKINAEKNRDLYGEIFYELFGFRPVIYALTGEEYIKAVSLYRQLAQINKLPAPRPITIK